jgi:hypothetical protein
MSKSARLAKTKKAALTEQRLQGWRLLERFSELLALAQEQVPASRRERHGLRQLDAPRYLRLFLLGVFNPVVTSMRALCQASQLPRVQRVACGQPVALARFSEAQAVFDPKVLRPVMAALVSRGAAQLDAAHGGRALAPSALQIIDSTLWTVLPRMAWASYGGGCTGAANGVRLHLKLRVADQMPVDALVTVGKVCERKALREHLRAGEVLIGDRNYAENYAVLTEIVARGGGFLFRLRKNAVLTWEQEETLTEAERQAGLVRAGWAGLGQSPGQGRWRVVRLERPGREPVLLVASAHFDDLSPGQLAELYRERWEIELFFRWLKCLVPCRHWFAESQQGVTFQIYLSLIYALLLSECLGCRPTKRLMELMAWRESGWATDADFLAGVARALREQEQRAARKKQA